MRAQFTRRSFLGASAGSTVAAGLAGLYPAVGAGSPSRLPGPMTRIRKIYLAKPVPSWPKPNLDVPGEVQRIEKILADLAGRMEGVRLEGGDLFRVPGDVPATLEGLGNPDGFLVFNLTSTVGEHLRRVAALGEPTVLFSQPYSGHDWSAVPGLRKGGLKAVCVSTSDYNEIPQACRLIRTTHLMRHTRVLYVNVAPYPEKSAAALKERLGVEVVSVGPDRINAAYEAVGSTEAAEEAREWMAGALRIVEPPQADITKSGRLYLALRRMMEEEQAAAVTINCLGMFAAKQLPAYPCLAFSKLNDQGLVGVCEADMDSTITQLLFEYAFGVPGFVSDPVIDTSTNTVIHAHCVSATRMDGPKGERAPYIIRTHLEDNAGVALQVKMRVGQAVTVAKLVNLDTMLLSTGTITDNPESDRGCRTKITTKVADARKMLNGYTGGLHRVIFYGDRVNAIRDLAALMQFNVVDEC